MTDTVYAHQGCTVLRRTANGSYIPIGDMRDEHLASYTALALNAAADPDTCDLTATGLGDVQEPR